MGAYKPALLLSWPPPAWPQKAPDPTAPGCIVTPPQAQGDTRRVGSQRSFPGSTLAGTMQTGEEVPAHQYLSTGTAGDHISNIFSLIVRVQLVVCFFFAFPPFQPPPCGSMQLSHCWNLPNAWAPAAQQCCLAVPSLPSPQTAQH